MKLRKRKEVRAILWAATISALLFAGRIADGHAVLKETSPAANSKVAGPDVPIILKFNVRIDSARSKLQLLNRDTSTTHLTLDKQSSPDALNTRATGLEPGPYRIRWQVLAPDGHITRGEIPFTVTAS